MFSLYNFSVKCIIKKKITYRRTVPYTNDSTNRGSIDSPLGAPGHFIKMLPFF